MSISLILLIKITTITVGNLYARRHIIQNKEQFGSNAQIKEVGGDFDLEMADLDDEIDGS